MKQSRKKLTQKEFVAKAVGVHGDRYDYSDSEYITTRTKIKIICKDHGEFYQKPNHHLSGSLCPECSKENKALTTEIFIKRAKYIYGDSYDYSLVDYKNNKTKVQIIDPINGSFWCLPKNHLDGYSPFYNRNSKDTEYFIEKSKKIHGDKYDYSKTVYKHNAEKVEIVCPEHGSFWQIPNNHSCPNGSGCPKCGKKYSSYEITLEEYLIKNNIDFKTHDRDILKQGELDFYLPKYNIAIEVNGIYWHSELHNKDRNYHLNKTKECEKNNIQLIQVTDIEMKYKNKIVQSKIKSIAGILKRKIHGRKCEIKEIDNSTKSKFLNKYHLQGDDKSSVKLGLFYKNRLVSVMTFCKRRIALGKKITEEGEYELSRYCGNFNFYVIGGASKLLKYFERNYKPSKIVTYADKRWSRGDVYYKLGFTHTHDSKPNYWYFQNGYIKTGEIYHRFNFRKSELPKKLDKFDPNKTEWENMVDNDWDRYWDCGNMVFEKVVKNG